MASGHAAQGQSTTYGLMARIMAERAAESRPTTYGAMKISRVALVGFQGLGLVE